MVCCAKPLAKWRVLETRHGRCARRADCIDYTANERVDSDVNTLRKVKEKNQFKPSIDVIVMKTRAVGLS